MYDLEQQRPSLVTFHQTNRLHDGLQPLNLHFTNQINILSKTSAEKNILNTQANQLLQAKQLFLIILQLHIFFFKVSCWDGNWTFSHGRVSGFVFLFFPDLNYTERRFESRFEELPCSQEAVREELKVCDASRELILGKSLLRICFE